MPSLQPLRRRLKSIQSIHQITRAMEMIATSKMKKATKKVVQARDYSESARDILSRLKNYSHPLLQEREIQKNAIILITSDRGLCGSFNSALLKELLNYVKMIENQKQEIALITIGKKGRDFVSRFLGDRLIADFTGLKDEILYEEITPIAHLVTQDFINKKYDRVYILYSHFVSGFSQKPMVLQILPVVPQTGGKNNEYILEPSPNQLLEILVPQLIETQIYQALLESKASEFSARMMAMKNATENAKDLMDELYLTYHSIRQATITSELTDMVTAKKAMEE